MVVLTASLTLQAPAPGERGQVLSLASVAAAGSTQPSIYLVHVYFQIDPEIIWQVVVDDIDPLRISVQRLLAELDN